jgi:hypothetical protein
MCVFLDLWCFIIVFYMDFWYSSFWSRSVVLVDEHAGGVHHHSTISGDTVVISTVHNRTITFI